MEKPGIEPATPGLQDKAIPYTFFVAFLGINQFRQVGLRFLLVLLWEHPKAHRKWFYGEAGNRTCDPWFTRHSAYPLHHGGWGVDHVRVHQYFLIDLIISSSFMDMQGLHN